MSRPVTIAALLLAGCALGPGEFHAVLAPSLDARLVTPAGRDAGDGWQRLNTDYQVRITALRLVTTEVALLDTGTPLQLSFNPARPPPGYSLCHNGHCHKNDGSLPTYEEVEAELTGRSVQRRVVASLPVGGIALVPGEARALSCEPSCALGAALIGAAQLPVRALRVEGAVRDGRASPRIAEQPFLLDLPAGDAALLTLQWALDVPADRRSPPHVALALLLHLGGALFDDIDFASLTPSAGT
ncbi:MAG: hypothetical protein ACK4N5_07105, partial [Myxococcales bacterium]